MKWHLNHSRHGSKPWAVQAEAMHRSEGLARYFYALEQGLGKTSLTLNDYIEYFLRKEVELAVIIAPQTFKRDWVLAPEEWGVGDLPTYLWEGKGTKTEMAELDAFARGERGLMAINYEAVSRSKVAKDLMHLIDSRKVFLGIDESSIIKNPGSAITAAVLDVAKGATMVRELNGTPQTQGVMDWYAQLRVVGQLNGKNRYQFRNRYAKMGGYMGKKVVGFDEERRDELFKLIDQVTFRALKKDWRKDLPPQYDADPVNLDMTSKQRRHYVEMMEDFYTEVDGMEVTAELVLTQMDKLRQISSCLVMQDGEAVFFEDPKHNPKVQATIDLMQGKKTIVVYQYRATGNMLHELFTEMGLQPARIAGATTMKSDQIIEDKARFNEDPACRVILAQQSAACMGHTLLGLPGDRCSRMVFFENSFNLRDRLQMRDRNHRGEQDEPCTYYDLCTSPMDHIYIANLQGKKTDADMVDEVIRCVQSRNW